MKVYYVRRDAPGRVIATVAWTVNGGADGHPLPHLERHSPDGFEYGYGGSGPADLARSIVGEVLGQKDPSITLYSRLKMEWVSQLEGAGPHSISEDEVRKIIGMELPEPDPEPGPPPGHAFS